MLILKICHDEKTTILSFDAAFAVCWRLVERMNLIPTILRKPYRIRREQTLPLCEELVQQIEGALVPKVQKRRTRKFSYSHRQHFQFWNNSWSRKNVFSFWSVAWFNPHPAKAVLYMLRKQGETDRIYCIGFVAVAISWPWQDEHKTFCFACLPRTLNFQSVFKWKSCGFGGKFRANCRTLQLFR